MEARKVGRSGLRISPIALGTANFGHVTDEADSHRIMSRALERGVTLFDTANIYNFASDDECTEAMLGRWLAEDDSRRDRIILNTKVYGTIGEGPNDRGLCARHIRMQCEASLRRLRTDRLDVYTLHHVDRDTPPEETAAALEQLRREGKILYYATSNFAAWQFVTLHLTSLAAGGAGLLYEQSGYNLTLRDVEREVLPACRAHCLGFLAYSPLADGVLAGPGDGARRNMDHVRARREQHADRLGRWESACREAGIAPATAALAWLAAVAGVTAFISGPRTPDQLDAAVEAVEMTLPAELAATAEMIWPGPGEAPEAYAW